MAVKLHRCAHTWLKIGHPCWTVQKALDETGTEYEVVKHPWLPRSRRTMLEELSGQRALPVIELEDGTVVREESSELAARIRAGGLEQQSSEGPGIVGRLLGRDK
jgi:glutaredoxin